MSYLLADIDATCAALGCSDGQKYTAETDAINGLKHLIWILRRDLENHEYRRHLGYSKILQTDLVYMLPDYMHDPEYADVLIRLLVILTNPTLLLYRDGPPKDNHGRKVFLELIDILQGYKSAFTREQIWTALFGKLQKGLEIDWAMRSEEQSVLIERILVLIRNVLHVPANPEAESRADNDASLHDQVIWALHQSGILDLVLFVVSSPDEHQFHMHGLEILCLLYREQTVASLANASLQRSTNEKLHDEQELLAARRRERQRLQVKPPPCRHSRFGGTYVIRNMKSVSDRDVICHQALERVAVIDFDREKQQQRRPHRHVKEEAQLTRRSAFSVRLCLREYCFEILRSAYNTLVHQVRRVLERNAGANGHDDSYLLWAIRFFMEFNRLSAMQLHLVSESLSVQCFHWTLTRMQHDMDMIVSDKKNARDWAKRLHVALKTFRELLLSLLALPGLQEDNARALFDMLLNNVCYVLEYRETILQLLMNYNEAHSTKFYLRDVIETANVFIKTMEKFCRDSAIVVQDKKRQRGQTTGKKTKEVLPTPEKTEEELANLWTPLSAELAALLEAELHLPEEEQVLPFDATAEKSIDDQKDDCMIKIHKLLRDGKVEHAILLLRAAREVWPENDVFGAMTAAPEDELLLLREIFMHNITTVDDAAQEDNARANAPESDSDNEEYDNDQPEVTDVDVVERTFKFEDFAKRLLHPKIVRACTVVLGDWEQIPTKSLRAAVTILHHIAYGCKCPGMLYQASLLRIFQQVFSAARDAHNEELLRLGVYVVRKFAQIAPTNPKIYAELLVYKSIKEANELESGYCDAYESGTKGTWTEEQEVELRMLFEENQHSPATDKDVIDWLLEHLLDKTRTRRGVLKKLKELGLTFKAPTKRSTANAAGGKNLWRPEEDAELRSLYDLYRIETNCLQSIVDEFGMRRTKEQIIKRMLQLHLIADKSEILPPKTSKRTTQKEPHTAGENVEGNGRSAASNKSKRPKKAAARKIVHSAVDVGTVRALLGQIDDKYAEATDWLRECLDDAAEDLDEAGVDDDGVPLVPLQQIAKDAMEDANFQKVLVALGVQPPIAGIENYWRIPMYLNAADLKLRARIVANEEVQPDLDGVEEAAADHSEEGAGEASSEEEDFFDGYLQRQRQQMEDLTYAKRDEEAAASAPLTAKKKQQRRTKKQSSVSDGANDVDEVKKPAKRRLGKEKQRPASESADGLFDQLKARRTTKNQISEELAKGEDSVEFDELNFNSEDYRARLLELGDYSDNDNSDDMKAAANDDASSSGDDAATNKAASASSFRNRIRRANVIDSDSDEANEEVETLKNKSNNAASASASPTAKVNDENECNNSLDKARTQALSAADDAGREGGIVVRGSDDNDPTSSTVAHKKRPRFDVEMEFDDDNNASRTDGVNMAGDAATGEADDEFVIARKNPIKTEQTGRAAGEKSSKRRRLAIIDDDDEDDD